MDFQVEQQDQNLALEERRPLENMEIFDSLSKVLDAQTGLP